MRHDPIIFNHVSSKSIGLTVLDSTMATPPEKRIQRFLVPGRDGELYRDSGNYKDIEIKVTLGFKTDDAGEWNKKYRDIKEWLRIKKNGSRLILGNDLEYFYKVKAVKLATPERVAFRYGEMIVTFTADPYQYLVDGENPIAIRSGDHFYTPFDCNPVYKITGEGTIHLNVNDESGSMLSANVGGNITIDTDRLLCYRATEQGIVYANSDLGGLKEIKDLRFKAGDNFIRMMNWGDKTVELIPNWRHL